MRLHKRWGALAVAAVLWLAGCSNAGSTDKTVILVSAAVSLKESLEPIAQAYEQEHKEIDIQYNYGSSGTLQKQIEQGVPADLFLSAGKKQMDDLIADQLVSESRHVLANRLMLVWHSDLEELGADLSSLLLPRVRKVAVGQPDTVPAGFYARQALTSLGLWSGLQSKLVYAQDVRQVLAFVESGNADAGLVYHSDLQTASANGWQYSTIEIPPDSHDPIVYPFGIVAASEHPKEAAAYYEYLSSEPALKIFLAKGFQQP